MHAALQTLQPADGQGEPLAASVPHARRAVAVPLLALAAVAVVVAGVWQIDGGRVGQAQAQAVAMGVALSSVPAIPPMPVEPEHLPTVQAPEPDAPFALVTVATEPALAEPPIEATPIEATPIEAAPIEAAPIATPRAPSLRVAAAETPGVLDTADEQRVAHVVAAIEHSIRERDFDASRRQLDDLSALLPARSLTLLRMQAWVTHQSGDAIQAIALYREILQRVPTDRNSAINLALLEAEQGDVEAALQRLQALRSNSGESAELATAMALVGAQRR